MSPLSNHSILGKRRNGPAKTIGIAHRPHLSRFTNRAKSQRSANSVAANPLSDAELTPAYESATETALVDKPADEEAHGHGHHHGHAH